MAVGPTNGLDRDCVVSCDHIHTIPVAHLGRRIGYLRLDQEPRLTSAIRAGFLLA